MKKISRVFLFGALVLVLLMAGCAGQEGTSTPFAPGAETSLPAVTDTEAVGTAETETPAAGATTEEATATEAATQEATSTATQQAAQDTPAVPVTGGDINVVDCQFCIDTMAFALLDIPAVATFEIVDPASPDPDTQCNTADTFNDRQVVLCRAPEETSITLNVCTDANTCSQVTVDLQACPVAAATAQPGAAATRTPTSGAGATATATATGGTPEATATGPTATPTP